MAFQNPWQPLICRHEINGFSADSREYLEGEKPRIIALCNAIWQVPQEKVEIYWMQGGGHNLVTGISITDQNGLMSQYVLRRPKNPERSRIRHIVALHYYLKSNSILPIGDICYWDEGYLNVIQSPYTIMKHIPGENLLTSLPYLPSESKVRLAIDLAIFYSAMLSTTAPFCGVPCHHESGGMHIAAFNRNYGVSDRFDQDPVPWMNGVSQQTPLEFFTHYFDNQSLDNIGNSWGPYAVRFSLIAKHMDDLGVFADSNDICLAHRDIAARNLMVTPDMPPDYQENVLSGIIDWDQAALVPWFAACDPPEWLWTPRLRPGQQTILPTEREDCQRMKRAFDDFMGPQFQRYAYDTQYRIARDMVLFVALDRGALLPSRHHDPPRDVLERWNSWVGSFGRIEMQVSLQSLQAEE